MWGIALDEAKERDQKIQSGGYEFLVDSDYNEIFSSFVVDYIEEGFRRGFAVRGESL